MIIEIQEDIDKAKREIEIIEQEKEILKFRIIWKRMTNAIIEVYDEWSYINSRIEKNLSEGKLFKAYERALWLNHKAFPFFQSIVNQADKLDFKYR